MKKENETLRICAWIFLIFGLILGAILISAGVVYNNGDTTKSQMFASLYFGLGSISIILNTLYSTCLFIIYKNQKSNNIKGGKNGK